MFVFQKQSLPLVVFFFIPPSLWPPNSRDLNHIDYTVWGSYKSVCTSTTGSRTWRSCASVSRRNGTVWTRKWLTTRSVNGATDWQPVLQLAEDILNIYSEHYCIVHILTNMFWTLFTLLRVKKNILIFPVRVIVWRLLWIFEFHKVV